MWKPIQVSSGISNNLYEQEQLANAVLELPEPKKSSGILKNKGKLVWQKSLETQDLT